MEEEILVSVRQRNCGHGKCGVYLDRGFDILYGFELIATRCFGCHKVLELKIRGLSLISNKRKAVAH